MIFLFIFDLILNLGFLIPSSLILVNFKNNDFRYVLIISFCIDLLLGTLFINVIIFSFIYFISKVIKLNNYYLYNFFIISFYFGIVYLFTSRDLIYYGYTLLVNCFLLFGYKYIFDTYILTGDEILNVKK